MTINFTKTDTTFDVIVNSKNVGTWNRVAEVENPYNFELDDNEFELTLNEPYISYLIKSTDTIQVSGTPLIGTFREKIANLKANVFFKSSAGGGGITIDDVTEAIFEPNVDPIVAVYKRKTILTDAQIKALPTTPVELVPAPGVGKVICFCFALFKKMQYAEVYNNISDNGFIGICYDGNTSLFVDNGFANDPGDININFLTRLLGNGTGNELLFQDPLIVSTNNGYNLPIELNAGGSFSDISNKNLSLAAAFNTGDFTDGDTSNSLEVTVLYSIVDI